jgi:DNA-binding beta-propeller fold protein YncE
MFHFNQRAFMGVFAIIIALTGCGERQMNAAFAPSGDFALAAAEADFAKGLTGTGVTHLLQAEDTADSTYIYLADVPNGRTKTFSLRTYSDPIGVTFDRSGATAYVAVDNQFLIIDVATRKILKRISIGGCSAEIAVTPDDKTALVPCGNSLLLISLSGDKVRSEISLSGLSYPTGIAVDSSGKTAYVVGNSGMAIVDVPKARQTGTVALPGGACWSGEITGVALVEQLHRAYAATCDQSGDEPLIAVIDTRSNKLLDSINVGTSRQWPIDVVASSTRPFVYVSVQASDGVHGQLVAIDTRTSKVSMSEILSWAPVALAMSPNGTAVFATTWEGTIWFHTDAKGFKKKMQGPICCSAADNGFGHFAD